MLFEALIRGGDIPIFVRGPLLLGMVSPRAHSVILSHFSRLCGIVEACLRFRFDVSAEYQGSMQFSILKVVQ